MTGVPNRAGFFSNKIIFILTVLVSLVFSLSVNPDLDAQENHAGAEIVWMDDPDEVTIRNKNGTVLKADLGIMIESGYIVETFESGAEIVLVPNGSVIILDRNTTFRIDSLQTSVRSEEPGENAFYLFLGKIRIVAARVIGASYLLKTPSAVAGVRGTDFYRMYDPAAVKDWICVTEGAVQLDPLSGSEGVLVAAGFFVNLTRGFIAEQPDDEWLKSNLTLNNIRRALLPQNR